MSDELELHEESLETIVLAPRPKPARPKTKLTDDERRAIVNQHEPVARAWAARYARKAKDWRIDQEEIVQEILLGFLDASRTYEPVHASKASFSTYAYRWVRGRISDFFKNKGREHYNHGGQPAREELEELEIVDTSEQTARPSEPKRHADRIRRLMSQIRKNEGAFSAFRAAVQSGGLDAKDLALIDATKRCRTQAEIAIELGCSFTTANARQRSLATKLNEIIGPHT